MDNEEFRTTYRAINKRFCPYEKSILTNHCKCSQAERFCIAEREGVSCNSDPAQIQCLELLEILRQQSRFALKSLGDGSALPHGKAMRIQVGGLRGLQSALSPEQPAPTVIEDVYGVIEAARKVYGSLVQLPFPLIMRQISSYQGRKRFRRRY